MTGIGFIGAGNMASAIIKGVHASERKIDAKLYVTDIDEGKAKGLSEYGAHYAKDAKEIAGLCKYVMLTIKPQQLDMVLSDIKDEITPQTVLVSNCAGISGEYIQARTSKDTKVILVMPNTPLLLGIGATAMALCAPVERGEFQLIKELYEACGIVEEIPEKLMKEVIAVNGSSPAFIYLYAKGFVDYGRKVGLDADAALRLFAQSLIGSAAMLTQSGMTVDELIKQVSSPGGTTLAGLAKLNDGNLTGIVENACNACTNRAYELSGDRK